jgi:uncharacterized membrane protein
MTTKGGSATENDGGSPMTTTTPQPAAVPSRDEPGEAAPGPWRRFLHRWHYDYVGLVGAVTMFCLSLTPSLLPRGHVLQALISGITAAVGYGLGVLIVWLIRKLSRRPLPGLRPVAWRWLGGVSAVAIVVFLFLGASWQHQLHELMGMDPPARFAFPVVLLLAALTAAGLVGIVRLLRQAARAAGRFMGRWIPAETARTLAGLLVVALTVGVLDGVVIDGFFAVTDSVYKTANGETDPGVQPPDDPLRSGGPGSLVSWASLGNQGRKFVAGGPGPDRIQGFAGAGTLQPIRTYVGLDSAPTSRERAALAVGELQRTGAFSRSVLCVITTTGTGWVDPLAVDPLEYLHNGDTAMVGMQYSYLPSWLSFLVDKERAHQAGRDLFNQVYGVWSKLPLGQRPRLVVFGESLGSFGAESAFSGVDDARNRVDGMLLVGPPNRSGMWREIVADRDPGTPEVLPTYDQGATVRFAHDPAVDLDRPATAWDTPRTVYLQHPSDPIVWWAPRLMLSRPDWLAEPRGPDVLPAMRWIPFVTFWQVTADMAFSTGVPAGHGHNYGAQTVAAWAAILPPDGWTAERTAALTEIIAKDAE